MPTASPEPAQTDPLSVFLHNVVEGRGRFPVPLISTRIDVTVDAGLAVVRTTRLFRNDEIASIEATLTFPMPSRAVLFDLEARVGKRTLHAIAARRDQSREAYEDAIERGKTAVLHEELLPGIHMLSVAHLPPGEEIEVTASWTSSLTLIEGAGHLRIPLTAGDVYGQSGLPDSDEMIHRGSAAPVELQVRCTSGSVEVLGETLSDGHAKVRANAPIDLVARNWSSRSIVGRTADGREVALQIEPVPPGEAPLSVAILVDRSSSMAEAASAQNTLTKHQAVVAGLQRLAGSLSEQDHVDLFEFCDVPDRVLPPRGPLTAAIGLFRESSATAALKSSIGALKRPSGGTEIGSALAFTLKKSSMRDILLITDGKSHALDVQDLARAGKRVSVILVGEDSLEADVGRLATLSGGDIVVAAGSDIRSAIESCVSALRSPFERSAVVTPHLENVSQLQGNAKLTARWSVASGLPDVPETARAVAAFATNLVLPFLDEEVATALAAREGLVTHLTSLILIDEEGQSQDSLPATRKIPLPSPMIAGRLCQPNRMYSTVMCDSLEMLSEPGVLRSPSFSRRASLAQRSPRKPADIWPSRLDEVAAAIDWDVEPQALAVGDLSSLAPALVELIESLAAMPDVCELAGQLQLDPVVLVMALLGHHRASESRSAARLAKTVLGDQPRTNIDALYHRLALRTLPGLSPLEHDFTVRWGGDD